MITKEKFLTDFNGHGNAYSSYKVINASLNDLIDALNDIDADMCVGSGKIESNAIYFEICKELPDLIQPITEKLHCVGFADIGDWYGSGYFVAYKDGKEYDDFTAAWDENCPERRDYDYENGESLSDEEVDWDAFVTVTDNPTGVTFQTGSGAVNYEIMSGWQELVNRH